MDSDVISIIRSAEAGCDEQYNAALEKSKEAVRDAKANAKANADAKVLAFNEQCQKRLEAAADSAKQNANSIKEGNRAQCKALQDVANQNIIYTFLHILGRIVG